MLSKMEPKQLRNLRRDIQVLIREVGAERTKPPNKFEQNKLVSRRFYLNRLEGKVNKAIENKADKALGSLAIKDFKSFMEDDRVKPFVSQLIKQTPWFRQQLKQNLSQSKDPGPDAHITGEIKPDARFTGELQGVHADVIRQLDAMIRDNPKVLSVETTSQGNKKYTLNLDLLQVSDSFETPLREVLEKMVKNKETAQVTFDTAVEIFGETETPEQGILITDERNIKDKSEGGISKRAGDKSHMVETGVREKGRSIKREKKAAVSKGESETQVSNAKTELEKEKGKSAISDGFQKMMQFVVSKRAALQRKANFQEMRKNFNGEEHKYADNRNKFFKIFHIGQNPQTIFQDAVNTLDTIEKADTIGVLESKDLLKYGSFVQRQ